MPRMHDGFAEFLGRLRYARRRSPPRGANGVADGYAPVIRHVLHVASNSPSMGDNCMARALENSSARPGQMSARLVDPDVLPRPDGIVRLLRQARQCLMWDIAAHETHLECVLFYLSAYII